MCLNSDEEEKARKNVKRKLHARRYGKSSQEVEEESLYLVIRPSMGRGWSENFAIFQIRKYFRMLTKKRYEGIVTIPNLAFWKSLSKGVLEAAKTEHSQWLWTKGEDPRRLCSNCRATDPKGVALLPKVGNCEGCGAWGLNT